MLDPRDRFLQATHPVIAAPKFAPLEDLAANGERYILAANGVFMQAQRSWLRCTRRVGALDPGLNLGYGFLTDTVALDFPVPVDLLDAFLHAARAALPNEVAGVLVWSEHTRSLRLAMSAAIASDRAFIDYKLAPLADGDTVAIDIHSHGAAPAGFSPTDDRDDPSVKLALVYGNVDRDVPTVALRLCLNGAFMPLDPAHDWRGVPSPYA